MRILHICHAYPPAIGGSEYVMRELSTRLANSHGHEVTVVTTTAYSTLAFRRPGTKVMVPGHELADGVVVRRHPPDPRLAPHIRTLQEQSFRFRLPGSGVLRTLYDGPISAGILRDACTLPGDVIGATAFPLLHMHVATLAGRSRRIPVVLLGALHPADRWGFDRGVIRTTIRRSTAYVAYTDFEADHVASLGVASSRIRVIPPGVVPESLGGGDGSGVRRALGIPEDGLVIGFVGQIGGHKGVDTLVRAMRFVWASQRDVWLVIAGAPTDFLAVVEREISKLNPGRRRRVRFLLDFPPDQKADLLASFDVLASPSGYESFGLTFIEAWSAGLPVVGCDAGAIASVVDHGTDGLLVPYGSHHALAGALIELVRDPALRASLGLAGRKKVVERFTWDRSAHALDALYASLAT
jgi:glycosyltransferase involved in cell wall biosynthesis